MSSKRGSAARTGVQARASVQKSPDFTPPRGDSGFGGVPGQERPAKPLSRCEEIVNTFLRQTQQLPAHEGGDSLEATAIGWRGVLPGTHRSELSLHPPHLKCSGITGAFIKLAAKAGLWPEN